MKKDVTRWLAEYLDDFDTYCQKTGCEGCIIRPMHEADKDKSCFRIYCELRDSGKCKPE